jgi:hypothetical protein
VCHVQKGRLVRSLVPRYVQIAHLAPSLHPGQSLALCVTAVNLVRRGPRNALNALLAHLALRKDPTHVWYALKDITAMLHLQRVVLVL